MALAEVCTEILVAVAPETDLPDVPGDVLPPVRAIPDPEPYAGPLAGLASALAEVDTPLAVVVGGDMPGLSPVVLIELILVVSEEGVDAAALAEGDGFRPLPCAIRARSLPVARRLLRDGERRLRTFLATVATRTIPEGRWRVLDPEAGSLRDIDTPEDLDPDG